MAAQVALAVRDFALDMCTNPWIVELSKNSRIDVVAIFMTSVYLFVVSLCKDFILILFRQVKFVSKYASTNFCLSQQTVDLQPVSVGGVVKIDFRVGTFEN